MHNIDNNKSPIGVFDSGIGGITVVKSIIDRLPQENIIYFGDLARLPYGTKSVRTIQKFAEQTVQFLIKKQVKAIVIACNTISAVAKEQINLLAGKIPVVDVISSGAESGKTGHKIGIIATPATINSNAYPLAIIQLNPNVQIFSQACTLFVPLIEEGFIKHQALKLIAHEYLQALKNKNIDTLILGCTHYPLIKDTITHIIGKKVKLIDPADSTCDKLIQVLTKKKLFNKSKKTPNYQFFVTEITPAFKVIGEQFLQTRINNLELVNLD